MSFSARPLNQWQLRTRTLALGERTRIFGIVNCTPDSFSGDGRQQAEEAVTHALRLLDEGADALDIGGESTRPGASAGTSAAISAPEEQDRVLPVIEALHRERPAAILSVDTYHAATARAALAAGVEIVNDVSGLRWDPQMRRTVAQLRPGFVLMHTRGRPSEWATQSVLHGQAVLADVRAGLKDGLDELLRNGLPLQSVLIDPGYGFGKSGAANYTLLAAQAELLALGRPLFVGLSRKGFLGTALTERTGGSTEPAERDGASVSAAVAAVLAGASVVRVHAVRPMVEAAAIADAVLEQA